jgi:hypothetical protein
MLECDCPPEEREPQHTVPWQKDFCQNCGNPISEDIDLTQES